MELSWVEEAVRRRLSERLKAHSVERHSLCVTFVTGAKSQRLSGFVLL
jgi:hypothetical protein